MLNRWYTPLIKFKQKYHVQLYEPILANSQSNVLLFKLNLSCITTDFCFCKISILFDPWRSIVFLRPLQKTASLAPRFGRRWPKLTIRGRRISNPIQSSPISSSISQGLFIYKIVATMVQGRSNTALKNHALIQNGEKLFSSTKQMTSKP